MELPEARMPPGFSEEDFIFSKLFKCVNFIGQSVICDVTRLMYSHKSIQSNGGSMPLDEYLKSVMDWSKKKFKDKITKFHGCLLSENLNNVDFDISFGYIVMTEACTGFFDSLSASCRENIDEFLKMRNKVCHNYGIETNELHLLVESLKNILEDIYSGVGEVVNVDFTDKIMNMKQNIESVINCKVHQIDIATYLEDVQKFRKCKRFCMIDGGRQELPKSYCQLQMDGVDTSLRIKDTAHEIDLNLLLKEKQNFNGVEVVPSALLVLGSSESCQSLCHYILSEWCKTDEDQVLVDGLTDFNLVIFVDVRKAQPKKLKDFLMNKLMKATCQRMKDTIESFDDDDIIPTLQDITVLFVIDGFEEAVDTSLILVREIFSKFGNRQILLTTHPEFCNDAIHLLRNSNFEINFSPLKLCL